MALFSLEEYESAKQAFEIALSIEKKKETETWIRKCNAEMQGEPLRVVLHFEELLSRSCCVS